MENEIVELYKYTFERQADLNTFFVALIGLIIASAWIWNYSIAVKQIESQVSKVFRKKEINHAEKIEDIIKAKVEEAVSEVEERFTVLELEMYRLYALITKEKGFSSVAFDWFMNALKNSIKLESGESVRLFVDFLKDMSSEEDFEEFGVFTAKAAGQEDKIVEMNVFMVKKWEGNITPDNEVEEVLWINSILPAGIKIGSIFEHEVLPRLKNMNLID